jgi:hypothetical protein
VSTLLISVSSFVEGAVKLNDRQRIEDMGLSVKSVMDAATNAFSASKQLFLYSEHSLFALSDLLLGCMPL